MATQTASVTVKPRSELGSRANKRLRDTGFVPGVIYGHKEAVVPITLPKKEVVNHLNHGTQLFDLAMDDGTGSWWLQPDDNWQARLNGPDGEPLRDLQERLIRTRGRRRAIDPVS